MTSHSLCNFFHSFAYLLLFIIFPHNFISLFLAVLHHCCSVGFSLAVASRGYLSSCDAWTSHCISFPCFCGAESLGCLGFSSHGRRAQRLWLIGSRHWLNSGGAHSVSMEDFPRSGIKLVSPASAGKFFTHEPPGKPYFSSLCFCSTFWEHY